MQAVDELVEVVENLSTVYEENFNVYRQVAYLKASRTPLSLLEPKQPAPPSKKK